MDAQDEDDQEKEAGREHETKMATSVGRRRDGSESASSLRGSGFRPGADDFQSGVGRSVCNLQADLHRFSLKDTGGRCQHVFHNCTKLIRVRTRKRRRLRFGDLAIQLRRNGMVDIEQVDKVMLWAEEAMETEVLDDETEDSEEDERGAVR